MTPFRTKNTARVRPMRSERRFLIHREAPGEQRIQPLEATHPANEPSTDERYAGWWFPEPPEVVSAA